MDRIVVAFGRSLAKVLVSFTAGGGVCALLMALFAYQDPEAWDLQGKARYGPPLGPFMLAVGVGLLTSALLLLMLMKRSWSRPLEPDGAGGSHPTSGRASG